MILAAPNAPDGTVAHKASYTASDFTKDSAILCRNTAPLVGLAYGLIQRDVPCRILGRGIGAALASLVRKMHTDSLSDLQQRLKTWRDNEVQRALHEERSPERIEDQYSCILFLCDSLDVDCKSVRDLLARIELLFSDEQNGGKVTLSTIHKFKGQESPRVFLLDWNLLPSRYAKQPWQLTQEKNLCYVAVTRSLSELYFIKSDCWKE